MVKIREYLKLARSFNAVLTGVSPVMGAIAMQQYDIFILLLLFLVGFFGHTFGFVYNDIIDYKLDKSSKEISDRPLISGTISMRNAKAFAIMSMLIAFIIAVYLVIKFSNFIPILVIVVSAFFIILYDLISKKLPFMDILVSIGIFFLILYGAFYGYSNGETVRDFSDITLIGWIVCILGAIQVLFMQIVAGGMKDVENDYIKGAKTAAIKLGVRISDGLLIVSNKFKALTFFIQICDIVVVFLPFFIITGFSQNATLQYIQWAILALVAILMFILSYRLISMKKFERKKARKLIGSHYMINFALVPVMLMSLNPWAGLLAFFPGLGFILSNVILHGTLLQPKTM